MIAATAATKPQLHQHLTTTMTIVHQPNNKPSNHPPIQPAVIPTDNPTNRPTIHPSIHPTDHPTSHSPSIRFKQQALVLLGQNLDNKTKTELRAQALCPSHAPLAAHMRARIRVPIT